MSLGNFLLRRLFRFRTPLVTPLVGVLCIGAACSVIASTNQDDGDQMEAQIERVDEMSGGLLKDYVTKISDYNDAFGDFVEYLEKNPEGASEYWQLIFTAVRKGGFGAVMIVGSAPPRFLLDTWVEATRPGGEFRDEFLERMASRDVERPIGVWDALEERHPDYALHKDYMRTHSVEEAAPLIEYMLRSHPLMAMDILLDIYPDQLPDAEAVFDDHWTIKKIDWKYDHSMHRGRAPHETLVALTRLSHHDVWWVRLYALSVTAERGPFKLRWDRPRDLRRDPNDAVKRAVNAINPPK